MKSKKLDTAIVIALPVVASLGWCTLVWDDPTVSLENKDFKHPDPITVDDPGLFLAPKATVVIVPPDPTGSVSVQHVPTAAHMKPVKVPEAGPTDWLEDPALDDLIGSCGKRHCDCSDTFESCESDIDCCNGYDACIDYKCERYEDY